MDHDIVRNTTKKHESNRSKNYDQKFGNESMQQMYQSNIHTNLTDHKMLDANDPKDSVQSKEINPHYNLISQLNNMKYFPHKKRKRY